MRFLVAMSLLCLMLDATAAVVEAIQKKAFLHRDGAQTALSIGQTLQAGDYITTTKESRVVIKLAEESLVRIGEFSRVKVANLKPAAENKGVFGGTFKVLKGVFRFTSQAKAPRKVDIQVGRTIAAGIRGTDLFVMAAKDKDWFCLIEGQARVKAGTVDILLFKPLQYLVVPKTKEAAASQNESLNPHVQPLPVGYLEEEKFKRWIKWTTLSQ